MNPGLRYFVAAMVAIVSGAALPTPSAAQPSPEDSRAVAGCYAGSGIRPIGRWQADTFPPPVLRLDTTRAPRRSRGRWSAAVLLRTGPHEASWEWRRDSVAVWITISYPQRYYMLSPKPDSLVGRGTDAADQFFVDAQGRRYAPEFPWRTSLRRVPGPLPAEPQGRDDQV